MVPWMMKERAAVTRRHDLLYRLRSVRAGAANLPAEGTQGRRLEFGCLEGAVLTLLGGFVEFETRAAGLTQA